MKKSFKIKWLSLMVTLCVAFGTVVSAALAVLPQAKAYGSDVTVTVNEQYVNAGEEFDFSVFAYSETGFSSYQLKMEVPDFVKVLGIVSLTDGTDANFEYAQKGSTYNITFTSNHNEYGDKTLFEVSACVDADAQGRSGMCAIYDAKFTDMNVSQLSVVINGAMFYVYGDSEIAKGDFNGDGGITIQDVMLMQRAIAHELKLSETQMYAGDIDKNGIVDIYDCQYVRLWLIGAIDDLENIGGEEPHGGNNICGTYEYQGEDGNLVLTLGDDKSYSIDGFGDVAYGSYKRVEMNDRIMVYLVSDFNLIIVSVDVDNRTFFPFHSMDFSKQEITVTGFAGTYNVQGAPEETITIAENGAFIRDCYEDGNFMQYNGMIDIKEVKDGMAFGLAYVFGIDESSAAMAMSFKLDMQNSVIYVEQSQYNDTYHIRFYVNGEMVADYSVAEGTLYQDVYNQFMNEKSEMLEKKYGGAINFEEYSTDTGNSVYGDSRVTSDDVIRFTAEDQTVWTENDKIYSVYNKDGGIKVYYYATREDILNALVGKTVSVAKVYINEKGEQNKEFFKEVTLTAEMIGDTSKIDFTPDGSSYPSIPLTIDGRTATLSVNLVPDMRGATFIREGVRESISYSDGEPRVSYYLVKLYDNGFMAVYQVTSDGKVNTDPNNYQQYDTEDYNGTTLYVMGTPAFYYVFDGTITLGRTAYQIFVGYKHAEGQETVDYTLKVAGMGETVFKVFNGEFAEMYGTSYFSEGLEYQGTVKVVIANGRFNFGGVEYAIDENNVLSLALPEKEPILVADIGGVEAWFYEGGLGFTVYGGQPMMSFEWVGNDDLTVITYTMMGHESCFYKWAIDGKYHADSEEPVWENATAIELMYNKDGVTTEYTLYRFQNGGDYLFDGNTIVNADAYYQANIFDTTNNMTGESTYYYYNAEGEMHDAVRYHIEDETGTHFGYMYAVPAKGILVGYWQATGAYISSEEFTFTVNADGDYVVAYNGKWLYTATSVMATNPKQNNVLLLVDYVGRTANGSGETGGDEYALPDMSRANLVKNLVALDEFTENGKVYTAYMFVQVYDNGFMVACEYGMQEAAPITDTDVWDYVPYTVQENNDQVVYVIGMEEWQMAYVASGDTYERYELWVPVGYEG